MASLAAWTLEAQDIPGVKTIEEELEDIPGVARTIYVRVHLDNGYTLSCICGSFSYGGSAGLWEIAVMRDGDLDYTTPITDDVLGYQSENEVLEVIRTAVALPSVVPALPAGNPFIKAAIEAGPDTGFDSNV